VPASRTTLLPVIHQVPGPPVLLGVDDFARPRADTVTPPSFQVDSHENVERNFEGNYLHRLR
jgi:hypothetical protein